MLRGLVVLIASLGTLVPAVPGSAEGARAEIELDAERGALSGTLRARVEISGDEALSVRLGEGFVLDAARVGDARARVGRSGPSAWSVSPDEAPAGPVDVVLAWSGAPPGDAASRIGPDGALLLPDAQWWPALDGTVADDPLADVRVELPDGWTRFDRGPPHRSGFLLAGTWSALRVGSGRARVVLVDAFGAKTGLVSGATELAALLRALTGVGGAYPWRDFLVVGVPSETSARIPGVLVTTPDLRREPAALADAARRAACRAWWGGAVREAPEDAGWAEGVCELVLTHDVADDPALAEAARRRWLREIDTGADAARRARAAFAAYRMRREIGDEAFLDALRELRARRLHETARWADLVVLASRAAGRDLSAVVRGTLGAFERPRLEIRDVSTHSRPGGRLFVRVELSTGVDRSLRVPFRLTDEAGRTYDGLAVGARGRAVGSVALDAEPRLVEIDPDAHVLRALDPLERPPTLRRAHAAQRLLVIAESLPSRLTLGARSAVARWGTTAAVEIVGEAEIAARAKAAASGPLSVWILGAPREETLAALGLALPPEVRATPERIVVAGRVLTADAPERWAVAALAPVDPAAPGGCLVGAFSPSGFRSALRIAEGRRDAGWVLGDGETVASGSLSPPGSPLVRKIPSEE